MGLFRRKTPLDAADNAQFIDLAYHIILGRAPDAEGRKHHLARLDSGQVSRDGVIYTFATSDEFKHRVRILYDPTDILFDFVELDDGSAFEKHVQSQPFEGAQLCELVNPRRWLEDGWRAYQREMTIIPMSLSDMHRKGWEWTQTIYGLDLLGALGPERRCLGVGAGHEPVAYWLANKTGEVIATDLYEGSWAVDGSREGDPTVLDDPKKYAPFPYREDRLRFMRMDGTKLDFPDESFDVVFSISSIEHFGGHEASARSMAEIGRVLKPGGVAAIATECIVNDSNHQEFFRIEELERYIVAPSGLKLIQKPTFRLPRKAIERPTIMPDEQTHTPHMALKAGNVVYTSVLFFFQKY
ncbi:Methyltransferase type 11 [Desulfarculus baarsii DSM 2075]|uniref:Methyltransferase type 11 n=1 Tax=Desulfarculus baarsii (strain ATCC 33931 / DSM 2075 / LMG 7858 / VKM B-1802 / 2st14) TaxID=644282 RepID=E1QL57_DESB2|nr:methyltransferase domain-containing protein [Desulfarculus baarsii]ADK85322.1 Methyltransferase type 11 [Desulfarculus baarsii DSM 2075]